MTIGRLAMGIFLFVLIAITVIVIILFVQGRRPVDKGAAYVALGSSFAAGLGLGERVAGSPLVCQRSINGYPQQLARMLAVPFTDMSCSGATVRHVLRGGQVFLGPQVAAIGPGTRLVTLTAGGNDIAYVGDMTLQAFRNRGGARGFLIGFFTKAGRPMAQRDFAALEGDLRATLREIARRAPHARIVVVSYPAILPVTGSCPQLGLTGAQADNLRPVAERLAAITRTVAGQEGATLIDMAMLSTDHGACGREPWVNGVAPATGAPFHPTLAGATATAHRIFEAVRQDFATR